MNPGPISSLSIPLISGYGLGMLRVSSVQKHKPGSSSAKTKTFNKDQSGVTTLILNVAGPIPSLISRGVKTFHIFTSEIEGKEKQKLENSFYINSLAIVNGDKVAVSFYNMDPIRHERHSFTIGGPYKIDIDIAFAENGEITLTANNQSTNQYYSKKHQPLLDGQVLALPQ